MISEAITHHKRIALSSNSRPNLSFDHQRDHTATHSPAIKPSHSHNPTHVTDHGSFRRNRPLATRNQLPNTPNVSTAFHFLHPVNPHFLHHHLPPKNISTHHADIIPVQQNLGQLRLRPRVVTASSSEPVQKHPARSRIRRQCPIREFANLQISTTHLTITGGTHNSITSSSTMLT